MLLNEGKFINTESLARHLYNHLMKVPEMQLGEEELSHVRPFRQWPELYEEFYELVLPYKKKTEEPFEEMVKRIKGEFLVRFIPDFHPEAIATMKDKHYQIFLYKQFFDHHKKRERIQVLAHELMHMIQFMFPYTPSAETDYYHEPLEIEAIAKDFVYDMRLKIRKGKINNQVEAKRYLMNHYIFKKFPIKAQRKMWKKILMDLYYYNPVNENLEEARYIEVGKLPELIFDKIESMLKEENFPHEIKNGAIKIYGKRAGKKQKIKSYCIVRYLFEQNNIWEEFKKLSNRYDKSLLKFQEEYFKKEFEIIIKPNFTDVSGIAFVSVDSITIAKEFFRFNRDEQLSILHHECVHLLQTQLPVMLGKYYEKLGTSKHEYNKDPFELQAYGKELVKDIGDLIRDNKIKNMKKVSRFITSHPYYEQTSQKYKSKMFKKVMSNVKSLYNLPEKENSFFESLNELKLPSTKLNDDELIDKILIRKQERKQTIESKFILIFFSILKTYNIEPETFINRYHKYVDKIESDSISIEEIMSFIRFAGVSAEHAKVAQVLRISTKRIENLKTRFETKLLEPIKRIFRHDATDKTYAGLHFTDTKKRYNAMLIKNLKKAEKVKDLKENVLKITDLLA